MTEKNQTLLVHAACLLAIAFAITLSLLPAIQSQPLVAQLLVGAAAWLYGKLTGKPAAPVLNKIIAQLEPERVEQIMSQRPPADGASS